MSIPANHPAIRQAVARGLVMPGREVTTKPTKYRSQAVVVDGVRFASKKEARRWGELKALEAAGVITDLERQVRFDLHAMGGRSVAIYWADFTFRENGKLVVEDVKSPPTRTKETYRLKKRFMAAEYGIEIKEV